MFFSWPVTEQKCEVLGDTSLEFLAGQEELQLLKHEKQISMLCLALSIQ
jgi:hypothetical protein